MINLNEKTCPYCGGILQKRGTVQRTIKFGDTKKVISIRRFSCKNCGKWHRELPEDIIPYKQYSKNIVDGFAKKRFNNNMEEYLDFPSEASINRWKRQ